MAVQAYLRGVEALLRGAHPPAATVFKAMLWTAAHAPDAALHAFRADVSGEVAPGAGYAAGGQNAPAAVVRDEPNNRVDLVFSAVSWLAPAGQTLTARGVSYYASTGDAAADALIAFNDFGADVSATNQALNLAAAGLRLQL